MNKDGDRKNSVIPEVNKLDKSAMKDQNAWEFNVHGKAEKSFFLEII